MINVGDRVNDCTVLAVAAQRHNVERAMTQPYRLVILARRDDGWHVTAHMSHDIDTSWTAGDYFHPERVNDAWDSFAACVTGKMR